MSGGSEASRSDRGQVRVETLPIALAVMALLFTYVVYHVVMAV